MRPVVRPVVRAGPSGLRSPMPNRRTLVPLILLNAVLLAALAGVSWSPAAEAQSRARGSYLMVAGSVQGGDPEVVWLLDEVNEELVAVVWNRERGELVGLGYRDLGVDAVTLRRGRD